MRGPMRSSLAMHPLNRTVAVLAMALAPAIAVAAALVARSAAGPAARTHPTRSGFSGRARSRHGHDAALAQRQPADEPGLGGQTSDDLRRARRTRPGLHLEDAGVVRRPDQRRRAARQRSPARPRRPEADGRAPVAGAATHARDGCGRDSWRHRHRPERLRRARDLARPSSTTSRCAPTTRARRRCWRTSRP